MYRKCLNKNLTSHILLISILTCIFLRLIDEKSGFNEDRDLLNKLRYILEYSYIPFQQID